MKTVLYFIFLVLFQINAMAQDDSALVLSTTDTTVIHNDSVYIKDSLPPSSPMYNKYGDLLHDDPLYNKKSGWVLPAVRVLMADAFVWGIDRYVFKYDWATTSTQDWRNNFNRSPEWDPDGFGVNFIGHPYAGSIYFNVARSNGYSYFGSLPFAIQGSFVWEWFAEKTPPSYNDLINTPISGAFLGEALYRISSNILDDRARGANRFWREFLAGLVNPTRALNRFTQGRMFRITSKEIYQKEPINVTLSTGFHKVNDKTGFDNKFFTGENNYILNTQVDYGDPFETRHRKPFDLFRLRLELSYGEDRHLLDHVNGYGILAGKNFKENRLLGGIFQHFDYWHNNIFEVAAFGFGGGLISKIPVSRKSNIYSNIHLGVMPLAGNNTQSGPVDSEFRHYNFGGGGLAKIEETINFGNWASLGFTGFLYWIHTYSGLPGNSLVGIFKPMATLKLFKNVHLGLEHLIYRNDRWLNDVPTLHLVRTEQKVFLQFFFEDHGRSGKYK